MRRKPRNQRPLKTPIKSFSELSAGWTRPNELGEDGEDHINIASYEATTPLGKFLNTGFPQPFTYPLIGKFASVDGLMAWLCSMDQGQNGKLVPEDGFRVAKTASAIRAIRNKRQVKNRFVVKNSSFIRANAIWFKLQAAPKMKELLLQAAMQKKIIANYNRIEGSHLRCCATDKTAVSIVKIITVIANALLKNEEPDFTFLIPSGQCVDLLGLKEVLTGLLGNTEVAKLEAEELERNSMVLRDDAGSDYTENHEAMTELLTQTEDGQQATGVCPEATPTRGVLGEGVCDHVPELEFGTLQKPPLNISVGNPIGLGSCSSEASVGVTNSTGCGCRDAEGY